MAVVSLRMFAASSTRLSLMACLPERSNVVSISLVEFSEVFLQDIVANVKNIPKMASNKFVGFIIKKFGDSDVHKTRLV